MQLKNKCGKIRKHFTLLKNKMASGLTIEEYDRRKQFLQEISSLTNAELIEIVRILRTHKFLYSENTNGVFFNNKMWFIVHQQNKIEPDMKSYVHNFVVFGASN